MSSMTSDDVLGVLLALLDGPDPVLDAVDMADWPVGAFEAFKRMGLLRLTQSGLMATCPNCPDRHLEPVAIQVGEDGTKRLFIHCPEDLRVEVSPEMCRGWAVDPAGFSGAIAKTINPRGSASAIVPDRLWRVGHIRVGGVKRQCVLARRMIEPDAASIANHIGPGGRRIVFVPYHAPDERVWPGHHVPAVIQLAEVASVENGALRLDHESIMAAIVEADEVAESRSVLPVDPQVKKQVVRQQVKEEIKGQLEDDVLVAAYKQEGSYRKAAEWLTNELGRSITKDKVARAVKRAGGCEAVMKTGDSASVARTVASQSRDRRKKISQYR